MFCVPLTAESNHKSGDQELLSFLQKYFFQNNWLENKTWLGFIQAVGLGYWIGFGKEKGNLEGE